MFKWFFIEIIDHSIVKYFFTILNHFNFWKQSFVAMINNDRKIVFIRNKFNIRNANNQNSHAMMSTNFLTRLKTKTTYLRIKYSIRILRTSFKSTRKRFYNTTASASYGKLKRSRVANSTEGSSNKRQRRSMTADFKRVQKKRHFCLLQTCSTHSERLSSARGDLRGLLWAMLNRRFCNHMAIDTTLVRHRKLEFFWSTQQDMYHTSAESKPADLSDD